MNLRPLGNAVIVRRLEADKTTAGGLVIPATAAEGAVLRATVVAVGRGRVTDHGHLIEPEVRAGDVVLLAQGRWVEITHDGEKLLAANAGDIIAVEV